MARAHVKDGVLRGCPTCGTKVAQADLRLRDFSWVNEALPGRIGGMDIDFVVTQSAARRGLAIEMKPPNALVSRGARMTYRDLIRGDVQWDAWSVWGPDDNGDVQRGQFDRGGRIQNVQTMPLDLLAEEVASWWACGETEECA